MQGGQASCLHLSPLPPHFGTAACPHGSRHARTGVVAAHVPALTRGTALE